MTDTPVFERLAVIGLGLVGGSVALGARQQGLAREVRGVDPNLDAADPIPLVPLTDAAQWADAIVLSVPVASVETVLAELAPHLGPESLVMDTASVKGPIARAARRLLRHPERCVGAHPMAGGDASGFQEARPDLFRGAACLVVREGNEPPAVVDRVEQFWQGLGTFTVGIRPDAHDAVTAVLSHAPHAIAYAYAKGLPQDETARLAGAGLRDFIRIARANPRLWCEILLMNRERVTEVLSRFEEDLGTIQAALARGDRQGLEEALREGRRAVETLERPMPSTRREGVA